MTKIAPSIATGSKSSLDTTIPASPPRRSLVVRQSTISERRRSDEAETAAGGGHDGHGHGHGHGPPSTAGLVLAGTVCFVLYFFFCIVFSATIFDALYPNEFGVAEGVGIVLLGIGIGCLSFSRGSGCKAILAGPDLLPVITAQECGIAVQTFIELSDRPQDTHKIIPTTLVSMIIGNVLVGLTFWGLGRAKKTSTFIGFIPSSVISGFLSCIGYKVIKLAVFVSTTYSLKFKYMDKILATYDDKVDPYIPIVMALFIGVPLYFIKRAHIVRTDLLILGFIVGPLVIFYIGVAISGESMQELRDTGWFLTTAHGCGSGSSSGSGSGSSSSSSSSGSSSSDGSDSSSSDGRRLAGGYGPYCPFDLAKFWSPLEVGYGTSPDSIAWGAIPQCIGIWIMGACMTALDNMLKLSSTENALKVDLDYNHEMQVGGAATLLSALLGGMPSYGQTKFNLINFSIIHTTSTSIPTITCGVLALATTFSGLSGWVINGLPRFLLAGLLVYSGAGFLVEKLWEERKKTTRTSFAIIWVIFIVNFVWEFFIKSELPAAIAPLLPGLLVVFLLGIVLAAFEFIAAFMTKAPLPDPLLGHQICSSALRPQAIEVRLGSMGAWFALMKLHGFIFFGSASIAYQELKQLLREQEEIPRSHRLRIIIFDCSGLTGIDPTAFNTMCKSRRLLLEEHGKLLVWAGLGRWEASFEKQGLLEGCRAFATTDIAVKWVEDELLRMGRRLARHVIQSNVALEKIHYRSTLSSVLSMSSSSPDRISQARLLRHAERRLFSPGDVIFDQRTAPDTALFMLTTGEVSIAEVFGSATDGEPRTIFPGSFFNHQRCVLPGSSAAAAAVLTGEASGAPMGGGGGAPVSATALSKVALLKFTKESFTMMQRQEPALALQLLLAVVRQAELQRQGRTRPVPTKAGVVEFVDVELEEEVSPCPLMGYAGDHQVQLTDFQKARFGEIFDLIDADGSGEIKLTELEEYVKSVGRAIPAEQLARLFISDKWDQDGNGALSKPEFLDFARLTLMAEIPTRFVTLVQGKHREIKAKSASGFVGRNDIPTLLKLLGVNLPPDISADEVMDVMDTDGSGDVDVDEILTGAAMVRREQTEVMHLIDVFNDIAKNSDKKGQLSAPYLHETLQIPIEEAEDLVFLADIDRFESGGAATDDKTEHTIDMTEFLRLIMDFSMYN